MMGSTAGWQGAWRTTAQKCPLISVSLWQVAGLRKGDPTFLLPSPTLVSPQVGKAGQHCSAPVVPCHEAWATAAGQQPDTFCSLLGGTEEGLYVTVEAQSPAGWPWSWQPLRAPVPRLLCHRVSVALQHSQSMQLAWDKGWC